MQVSLFARSIQQGCHLTGVFLLLLSVALLWVGAVQCAFGVKLGFPFVFSFNGCSFPKTSWMLPQQACCLRRGDAEAVAFCRLAGGCAKGA